MMRSPKKTHRSDALRSLHAAATDSHAVGAIDKATMCRFDFACLTSVKALIPRKIN
ncbi:hypothetical protein JHFBIEKO_2597 [Methylobacterium mesophilicum]|jgi:putative transcriptional regulator|nr:hypothetical protein JHFBIEKO_2597 [Methylobacterium mesophilicum]